MLARRAVGRVEQMSQQSPQAGGASYDTAAVMLDVPADKVYAAVAARRCRTRKASRSRARFRRAARGVHQRPAGRGHQGERLGDNLTHMMITSAHTGNQPNAAALVLNGVLRVCKDMNVECSQARP